MRVNNFKIRQCIWFRLVISLIICLLVTQPVLPLASAQMARPILLDMPAPGTLIFKSEPFVPATIRGLSIDPTDHFRMSFLIDGGDDDLQGELLKQESEKLIKYFLTALTIPEEDMWVNLSPHEEDRIIAETLGQTRMGRDVLAQDYLLKQLTASLIYPEEDLGAAFWEKIYKKAYELYGTTDIPINTFNKVWIVPDRASVHINGNDIYITDAHLKVLLEKDYLAMSRHNTDSPFGSGHTAQADIQDINDAASEIVRELVVKEIEQEVNEGKSFANLRQIFHAMILATWYKKNLKQTLLGQNYADKSKTAGIESPDEDAQHEIYNRYMQAFRTGVFDYIKDDIDPGSGELIPRKYFSGGVSLKASVTEQAGGRLRELLGRWITRPMHNIRVWWTSTGSTVSEEGTQMSRRDAIKAAAAAALTAGLLGQTSDTTEAAARRRYNFPEYNLEIFPVTRFNSRIRTFAMQFAQDMNLFSTVAPHEMLPANKEYFVSKSNSDLTTDYGNLIEEYYSAATSEGRNAAILKIYDHVIENNYIDDQLLYLLSTSKTKMKQFRMNEDKPFVYNQGNDEKGNDDEIFIPITPVRHVRLIRQAYRISKQFGDDFTKYYQAQSHNAQINVLRQFNEKYFVPNGVSASAILINLKQGDTVLMSDIEVELVMAGRGELLRASVSGRPFHILFGNLMTQRTHGRAGYVVPGTSTAVLNMYFEDNAVRNLYTKNMSGYVEDHLPPNPTPQDQNVANAVLRDVMWLIDLQMNKPNTSFEDIASGDLTLTRSIPYLRVTFHEVQPY